MKCTVLQPLHHDGKAFEPGASVDLPDEQAAALAALGVVKPAAKPAKSEDPGK